MFSSIRATAEVRYKFSDLVFVLDNRDFFFREDVLTLNVHFTEL